MANEKKGTFEKSSDIGISKKRRHPLRRPIEEDSKNSMNKEKVDWNAIIMSLMACFFALTIGSDVWTLELLSVVVPCLLIYNLIPYIVRLYVGVLKNDKK